MSKLLKEAALLLIISSITRFVSSQDKIFSNDYREITFKSCYGFIADVGNKNDLLIRAHIKPIEFDFSRPIKIRYSWQKVLPNVEKGIYLRYVNLENPEYLGSLYVVSPFIKATVINTRFWKLRLSSSMGLVYASKIYHRTENYRNDIFGSHVNIAVAFAIDNSFSISKKVTISAGIDFSHFSNGETTLPNSGMNNGTMFLSVGYHFENQKDTNIYKLTDNVTNRIRKFAIITAIGWKDLSPVKSSKYLTTALSLEFGLPVTELQKVGAGAVIFYDGSMRSLYRADIEDGIESGNSYRQLTAGIYIFHDLNLYPLILHIETGYFLIEDRVPGRSDVFNRFGIRYYLNNHFFINFLHKSHFFFKGDNLEWGTGIIF